MLGPRRLTRIPEISPCFHNSSQIGRDSQRLKGTSKAKADHVGEDHVTAEGTQRSPIVAHTVTYRGDTSHYPLYEFAMKV
jgi:hypothetical protein